MDSTKSPNDDDQSVQEMPSTEYTVEEEKAVVRRIDLVLMPTIWVMYLLSYADRTNIGNAKVAGMADDLSLSSNDYSLALVIFFISYIIFEVPSNLLLSRLRPSIYIPSIMIAWGVVTCCMSLVRTAESLMAVRFILGIPEAGFAPGIMFMLSSWYRKDEQAKRFTIFYSAAVLSGAFGGIVAGAITSTLDGARGIAGWRWLFIVEGAATITAAVIAIFILPDYPANSKALTLEQRNIAVKRLEQDNITAETEDLAPMSPVAAIRTSLSDWRTWILTIGYMALGSSATMSYFYPTLVQGLGYTSTMAQYMVVPIYAVAFVAVLTTGYFNDKFPTVRGAVIASWVGLATICSIVVCAVYNFTARYVLLVFMASGLLSGNALSLAYASSTFAPMRRETRAVSLAWVNTLGNLSQIYGAYFFPAEDSPKYLMGFAVISGLGALCATIYATAHVLIRRYPAHS